MITEIRRIGERVRWYVGSVMGDCDYERYLAHHARHDHSTPPLTERDYWRERYDRQDHHPEGRCC